MRVRTYGGGSGRANYLNRRNFSDRLANSSFMETPTKFLSTAQFAFNSGKGEFSAKSSSLGFPSGYAPKVVMLKSEKTGVIKVFLQVQSSEQACAYSEKQGDFSLVILMVSEN